MDEGEKENKNSSFANKRINWIKVKLATWEKCYFNAKFWYKILITDKFAIILLMLR